MKRSKRSVAQSPSSSTPAISRHGLQMSPLFGYGNRDSDAENSTEQCAPVSPLMSKSRLASIRYSPLNVDVRGQRSIFSNTSHINGSNCSTSPDGLHFKVDLNDRSIGRGYLSDHLLHSLSYARHLEQRASHITNRLNSSANISMSPRLLFSPETSDNVSSMESIAERQRASLLDELNLHSYATISQHTTSTVERYARLADVCPDLLCRPTVNRFTKPFVPGEKYQEERPPGMNTVFNCNNLAGSFSNLVDIAHTRLAVLYKARHRLSGVLDSEKRSRSDFEATRSCGSSSSEMLNEVQALALLQHPNIVHFYGSWYEADSVYTQLEYCLGGSLFNFLHPDRENDTSEIMPRLNSSAPCADNEAIESTTGATSSDEEANCYRLSENLLIVLCAHVVSALHYMHTTWSMVHGDVKPSNILIQLRRPEAYLASTKESIEVDAKQHCHKLLLNGDTSGVLFKLTDFGRASRAGEDRDGEDLGDGRFLPSLNDPSPPARAATGRDIYALGITLYHSAGGSLSSTIWERFRETGCLPDLSILPTCLIPIVKNLLKPLAQDRPTVTELFNLPLFRPHVYISPDDAVPQVNLTSTK